jgi:hypothetical protein
VAGPGDVLLVAHLSGPSDDSVFAIRVLDALADEPEGGAHERTEVLTAGLITET